MAFTKFFSFLFRKIGLLHFICLFLFVAVLATIPAAKADSLKRILILESMSVPAVHEHSKWFLAQMRDFGYRDEENIEIIIKNAEGDQQKAEDLLNETLSEGNLDLVVTNATLASQAAYEILKAKNIPQVFLTVSDPVGAGLIKKIGRPTGSHITGKVFTIDRQAKITNVMRLVRQIIPKRKIRFGFLHASYPSAVGDLQKLQEIAADRRDIVFVPYPVPYTTGPGGDEKMLLDAKKGIDLIQDNVDFWWEPSGPLGEMLEFTDLLVKESKRPVAYGIKLASVKRGALFHLTPDMEKSGRETGMLAYAILAGTDPGAIPPTAPSSFLLGINLTTALKNKIAIPSDMLELAGDHIFK